MTRYDPLYPDYEYSLRLARLLFWAVFVAIVIGIMYASGLLVIFEDGSFALGTGYPWWISGCIPFQLCGG